MLKKRCLACLLMGLAVAGSLKSEDGIFQKNNPKPMLGSIVKVDDASVYLQLGAAGTTTLPRNSIERVEITRPSSLDPALKAAADGKGGEAIRGLEPLYQKYRGLPCEWLEKATVSLGQAYLDAGSFSKGRDLFAGFKKFYPQSPLKDVASVGEAEALAGLGQSDQAIQTLVGVTSTKGREMWVSDEQNRALGRAWYTLGKQYLQTQKTNEALDAFLRVTTLYSQDANATAGALYESALLFENSKNIVRAMDQLEEYLKEHPQGIQVAEAQKRLDLLKTKK